MARIRSSVREASRHTGDQYEQGYQYRFPKPWQLTLGPWRRVWPLGNRNIPADTLQELRNGVLVDGSVRAIWLLTNDTEAARTVVGDYEFDILSTPIRFMFYIDHADLDKLKIEYTDGSSTTTVDTGLTPGDAIHVVAVPWQDKLYYSFKGAGQLYVLDLTADTHAAVAASPEAEFMLILQNNLLVINQSGQSFQVQWSVDSDPEDFVNAGSGSNVIPASIGRPQGFEHYKQDAILIGSTGGWLVTATGTTPAFTFDLRSDITGAIWTYVVEGTGGSVFYIGRDRLLRVYDGSERTAGVAANRTLTAYDGSEIGAGVGGKRFDNEVVLYYSRRLRRLLVSDRTDDETYILDIDSQEWVANVDQGWDWISDCPSAFNEGQLLGSYNEDDGSRSFSRMDLAPQIFDAPYIKTGRYYIGREVMISHIDVIRDNVNAPRPMSLGLTHSYAGNVQDSLELQGIANGVDDHTTFVRYFINRPASSLQLTFTESASAALTDGPFLTDILTAEGNAPIDLANTGYRGNLNGDGNVEILPDAVEVFAGALDDQGNLELEIQGNLWDVNEGIERIEIYGEELAPDA